jgi:hypothetical protein
MEFHYCVPNVPLLVALWTFKSYSFDAFWNLISEFNEVVFENSGDQSIRSRLAAETSEDSK